ncbi:hypothetical protein [Geobacter sp.]|uniref:hypothetical protein n=1 Tax=Geobacter sp. TaxID=46610 RepID=UPI00263822D6|nr:hypothetical protein [Geobacter sp.]
MTAIRFINPALIFILVWQLASCGGSSSTNPSPTDNNKPLMGGAAQGNSLSLVGTVSTFAGTAGVSGSTDGIGATASFRYPVGVTTDGANLFVTDYTNSTIRKIVIASGVVSTLAGTAWTHGTTDGIGSAASFYDPVGITTDGKNLYVADSTNHTIRKIVIANGEVTTLAGTAGTSGSADGIGIAASFNFPKGITTDGTNLYVADIGNHTIRKIVISTGAVTTLAGTAGTVGATDGIGTVANFITPEGITTDGKNVYVTDNTTIRKIVIATSEVTTLAGAASTVGTTDGIGSAARFSGSKGITTDGTFLYVTDYSNFTIRKIEISTGTVTTLAGSVGSMGSTDGTGAAASFFLPTGITSDGKNLYVTDTRNNTIRKIQ